MHANVIQLCDILGEMGFYVVLPDLINGKPLTEAEGGKMVITALSKLKGLKGGAIVHLALIEAGDMAKVNAPLMVLPSKDEPDFTAEFDIIVFYLSSDGTALRAVTVEETLKYPF
ncbi:hypothetical protein IW136_002128 [Coemansia sp. RSA 678]|nr:hypothetical protein IW136_002128 [Coemansia sp. RSA 678]